MKRKPNTFIFMKVGNHAGETFEEILERKNEEYKKTGRIFWGYGGNTLHPLKHVQPFVKTHLTKLGSIYLLMQPIISNADPELLPAREYSEDGINWKPIPNDINVTGSRYALILDEIKAGDLDFYPNQYEVGVGPSRGKSAQDYIRGRVDKGCLIKREDELAYLPKSKPRKIEYTAKLLDPYAVLLR